MTNLKETLIIVTADHSHSFQLFGEPSRFQNILDIDETFSKKVSVKGATRKKTFSIQTSVKDTHLQA